jgi:hypothetical protein
MSFCNFAVNAADAIDMGIAYDYDEPVEDDMKPPQLLWLSDIPLFNSIRTQRARAALANEEEYKGEKMCTFEPASVRAKYRQVEQDSLDSESVLMSTAFKRPYYAEEYRDGTGSYDDFAFMDDKDWDVVRETSYPMIDGKTARVLEPTPEWYEKYSCAFSIAKPTEIILTLESMLVCDDRIEFQVTEASYQVRNIK